MNHRLPMFGLNAVLFPGMTLPLHIFEDRYRLMVESLVRIRDVSQRLFFSVAIREGYEVGDHGVQSLYRVGNRLQLTEVSQRPDGTYQVMALVRDRIKLNGLHTDGPFPEGDVELLVESGSADPGLVASVVDKFAQLTNTLAALGTDISVDHLPSDPAYIAWTLAASAPLAMAERQALLEAEGPTERLSLLHSYLCGELRAIAAIPSLPATDLARTRWSPN